MKIIDINEINDNYPVSTIREEKQEDIENNGYSIYKNDSNLELTSFHPKTSLLYELDAFIKDQFVAYGLDMFLRNSKDLNSISSLKSEYYHLLSENKINLSQYSDFILKYVDSLLLHEKVIYFDKKNNDFENVSENEMYIVVSDNCDVASKVLYDYCKDKNLDNYSYLKQYIEKKKANEENYSKSMKRK